MSRVTLQTDDGYYFGWKSVSIKRSLEQLANTFQLSVTDAGIKRIGKHPLKLGASCKVMIDNVPVLNGFVEEVNPSFSADSHTITVSGRDLTGDLVDCSAIIPNQELHNADLAAAAAALCKDYQVGIDCPDPGAPFEKFVVNDGETIFSVLESHARQRGLLLYTLGDAVLHICKPEPLPIKAELIEGENILNASARHSTKQRFNHYLVKSQKSGSTGESSEYTDPAVRAPRTRIIRAEKPEGRADCANRAAFEAKLRAAQGRRATITVQGWEWTPGKLWDLRHTLPVKSDRLGINEALMVVSVDFGLDDSGGSVTTLELVPPEVYANA